MNRGKCRRKFSRSALFLVLSAGLRRGGRGLGAAAGTPLMKILGHRGRNDRKDGQNHDDLQIRQLMIGIEQGLQNVAHSTVPFRSRRNRSEEVGRHSQMLPFSSGFMGAAMTASTMVMAAEKPVQKVARYSTPKTGRLA